MSARGGKQYLEGLREAEREVWIDGERVDDVTSHPAFRRGARSLAELYDMQLSPELRGEMTYPSPTTGDDVGLSFLTPRSQDDLERRSRMMARWARFSGGMMGRTPDYLNSSLMAQAAAADFFARNRPEFGDNV